MKKIILASASPRRQELLQLLALPFEIIPAHIPEEIPDRSSDPAAIARALATDKARCVAAHHDPETLVLGADTLVVLGEEVLGKPRDEADALAMLWRLQGRVHKVVTGLAVVSGQVGDGPRLEIVEAVVTEVTFRPADRDELARYVATGEPLDKAGAYAIQGRGCVFIESIRGCYFNVVGLPVFRLAQMLGVFGIQVL